MMALRKTNNSAELNPYDGSIEQIVNNNLGTGYEANTPNASIQITNTPDDDLNCI